MDGQTWWVNGVVQELLRSRGGYGGGPASLWPPCEPKPGSGHLGIFVPSFLQGARAFRVLPEDSLGTYFALEVRMGKQCTTLLTG